MQLPGLEEFFRKTPPRKICGYATDYVIQKLLICEKYSGIFIKISHGNGEYYCSSSA